MYCRCFPAVQFRWSRHPSSKRMERGSKVDQPMGKRSTEKRKKKKKKSDLTDNALALCVEQKAKSGSIRMERRGKTSRSDSLWR